MAEISFTLKAGTGFDSPWIVVKAESVQEASDICEELRELGAFTAVRTMAHEFQAAPLAGQAAVEAAVPGTTVVYDGPAAGAPASGGPPQQSTPPCETCGKPTKFKSGTGRTGPWSAYMCSSDDRSHTKFL